MADKHGSQPCLGYHAPCTCGPVREIPESLCLSLSRLPFQCKHIQVPNELPQIDAAGARQGSKLRRHTKVQTQIYQQPHCGATGTPLSPCLIYCEAHSQSHLPQVQGAFREGGGEGVELPVLAQAGTLTLASSLLLHLLPRVTLTKFGQGWGLRPLRNVFADSSRSLPLTFHAILSPCVSGVSPLR